MGAINGFANSLNVSARNFEIEEKYTKSEFLTLKVFIKKYVTCFGLRLNIEKDDQTMVINNEQV